MGLRSRAAGLEKPDSTCQVSSCWTELLANASDSDRLKRDMELMPL